MFTIVFIANSSLYATLSSVQSLRTPYYLQLPMFHILSNCNLFLGLSENDITAKMAYFGPSFDLSPFATTFSHPLPTKNLQTFLPKSNYKIHFVTCMMLHITNLTDCSRDK